MTDIEKGDDELNGQGVGHEAALEFLLLRHERAALNLAWGILRNWQAAEDVAQEALVRLWQKHQKQAVVERCDAWLRKVVLNLSRDRLRREGLFRGHEAIQQDALASCARPAELTAEASEDEARLRACIDALPQQQRRSILLVFGEGLRHEDAAELMGCSKKTLCNHIRAAKAALISHAQEKRFK